MTLRLPFRETFLRKTVCETVREGNISRPISNRWTDRPCCCGCVKASNLENDVGFGNFGVELGSFFPRRIVEPLASFFLGAL